MDEPSHHRAVFLLGPERLELRRVPTPRPGEGELLLRIDAALTCGTDVKVFRRGGHPRMLTVPGPFGHELAGTVLETGLGVERFRPGDAVVVANSAPCGRCRPCAEGRENLCRDLAYLNGAFAERLLVPARFAAASVHALPAGLAPRCAALAEPLACVLHAVERSALPGPSDALILGAGPLGLLFTALLLRRRHRVVLADPNPGRLDAGARLGARPLRVERGAPAELLRAEAADHAGFDLAVDATGSAAGWERAIEAARLGGLVNLFGGCPPGTTIRTDTGRLHYGELSLVGSYHHRPANFADAIALLAAGEVPAEPLLSAERPLEEIEEALRSMIRREALKVVLRP